MPDRPRYDPFDEVRRRGQGRGSGGAEEGSRPRFESVAEDMAERRKNSLDRTIHRAEHQSLWNELGRVLFIAACILVDGLWVTTPLVALRPYGDLVRWSVFLPLLVGAAYLEFRVYRRFWPKGWDEPDADEP